MRLYHKIAAMAASVFLLASIVNAAIPAGYAGTVFDSLKGKPSQIPGFVTAAYFDKGADGVTFHYTWTNMGDCHWRDGDPGKVVSLQFFGAYKDFVAGTVGGIVDSACYPVNANCHIGWVQSGEWLNYTVHVNTAGKYKMILHHSVVDTSNLILFNIGDLPTDSVGGLPASIRPPGDHEINHDWKWDTTKTRLVLDTGLYVLKVSFFHEGLNFHGMKFLLDAGSPVIQTNRGQVQNGFEVMPVVNGNNLTLSYSLAQAGVSRISVYDCAGRLMAPAIIKNQYAGTCTQTIGLSSLGTGVHFVRVEHSGLSEIKSFTVTR
jgi:hypothetical protein